MQLLLHLPGFTSYRLCPSNDLELPDRVSAELLFVVQLLPFTELLNLLINRLLELWAVDQDELKRLFDVLERGLDDLQPEFFLLFSEPLHVLVAALDDNRRLHRIVEAPKIVSHFVPT